LAKQPDAKAFGGVPTIDTPLTTVILRCSPFFTASLEGWATSAGFQPSRLAQEGEHLRMTAVYVMHSGVVGTAQARLLHLAPPFRGAR
jgi:hypothetical protein